MFGITIDDPWNYKNIVKTLPTVPRRIVTRVIIDDIEDLSQYAVPIKEISKVAEIMLCVCDSYAIKNIPTDRYLERVSFLKENFSKEVLIWEVGNEVNGDWLGDNVVDKVAGAISILNSEIKAITFHADAKESFIPWIRKNEALVKKCRYLLASEYPQDTNYWMNWQKHIPYFQSIGRLYGYGECGTKRSRNKVQEFDYYYVRKHKELSTAPRYVGGYFWWYQKDFIPKGFFSSTPLLSSLRRVCS